MLFSGSQTDGSSSFSSPEQNMDAQMEKVYVAVGNDLTEGLGTLDWALKKWSGSQTICFVIVHVDNNPKDLVSTPFGKLPASSVNDEKLDIIRMCEQEKTDKLLAKYRAFCGKAKTEVLKVERSEEQIHKAIVGFISSHQVTKLVMGITLVRQSSWKAKGAISVSFYIHRNKPSFCELYVICGGKLVFLREENDEEFMEDERGVMVAKIKEKASVRGWFGKMFVDNVASHEPQAFGKGYHHRGLLPTSAAMDTESVSSSTRDWWEDYGPEVESYFQGLLSSSDLVENEGTMRPTSTEIPKLELEHIVSGDSLGAPNRVEALKIKIQEAQKFIEERREEAKGCVERQLRAESIITLCNRRAVELEARISEEINHRNELKKKIEAAREHIYEVSSDIEENKRRLPSILELQSELATKLQSTSLAKSHVEAQLENSTTARTEILREMEELRRQRDLLHRRIEFCRQREAIAAATTSSSSGTDHLDFSYREFTADEIKAATDHFSQQMKVEKREDQTNSYRGWLNHMAIAIELPDSLTVTSQEEFRDKVELQSQFRHPHLVNMIGACSELKCIVYEYMRNGSLQDLLFSVQRNSNTNLIYKRDPSRLRWHLRIRIAAEISLGLVFLHQAQPRPIVHGELNLSNVLLDRNFVAKITTSKLSHCSDQSQLRSDLYNFGVVILQLLTGRGRDGLVEEVRNAVEAGVLKEILDAMAGEWPLDLAMELASIALKCVSSIELTTATVMKEVEEVGRKAVQLIEKEGSEMVVEESSSRDSGDIPYIFLCPILQEVMHNPHVAADGFSYELGAIAEWLGTGHETSPMTNLKLEHKLLTPNHSLRSLIQEWLNS